MSQRSRIDDILKELSNIKKLLAYPKYRIKKHASSNLQFDSRLIFLQLNDTIKLGGE